MQIANKVHGRVFEYAKFLLLFLVAEHCFVLTICRLIILVHNHKVAFQYTVKDGTANLSPNILLGECNALWASEVRCR